MGNKRNRKGFRKCTTTALKNQLRAHCAKIRSKKILPNAGKDSGETSELQMGESTASLTTQNETVQSNYMIEVTPIENPLSANPGPPTWDFVVKAPNGSELVAETDTSLANKSETEAAVASLSDPYGFNIDLEEEKESNNESEPETDPEPEPENEAQPLSEELSRPDVYDCFAEALADELRSFPKKEGNKMMKKIKILMNRCKNEIDFYNSLKSKTEQSKSKPSDNKTQPKNTESKKKPAGQTTKTNDRASGNNEDKRKAPPTNTKKRTVEEEPVSTLSKKKQKTVPVNTEDIPQVSPEVSSNTAEHSEAEQRKAEQSKAEAEAEQREARYRYLKKYLAEKNAAKETPPVQPIQIEDEAEAEPEPEILPPPEDINPVGPDPLIVKVETTADVGNQSTSKVIDLVESEPPTSHIKTEQGERCDSPEEYVEITEKYPYIGQL